MANFSVHTRKLQLAEYQLLRGTTNWSQIENQVVERALENDLFSVAVFEGDQIIGMGRIIGDGAIYFYIQDVIVSPKYQNKGVGITIMNHIENFLSKNAPQNAFIGLMAAEGVQSFYPRFGYKARPEDRPGMYKTID